MKVIIVKPFTNPYVANIHLATAKILKVCPTTSLINI